MKQHTTTCQRCIRTDRSYTNGLAAFTLNAVIIILCAGTAIGCASSGSGSRYMTSFPDPAYLGRAFNRVAIHYDSPTLAYRKEVESRLAEELLDHDVTAVESSRIIPPTRTWDSAGIRNALIAAGIDGYVRIVEVESWTENVVVPPKATTEVQRKAEQRNGTESKEKPTAGERNDSTGKEEVIRVVETETTTTTTSGGYSYDVTWRRFNVELIDLGTGRLAWLGTTTVRGSVSSGSEDFSEQIAGQLRQDGMVRSHD